MPELNLKVNGTEYELKVSATATLAEVLREELGFTGTKMMCNEGECGACTVLINGKPMLSCMMLAADARNKEIVTIEGLADPVTGELHPIQKAFVELSGMQCGVCTPGMILTAKALLDQESQSDGRRHPEGPFRKSVPMRELSKDHRMRVVRS